MCGIDLGCQRQSLESKAGCQTIEAQDKSREMALISSDVEDLHQLLDEYKQHVQGTIHPSGPYSVQSVGAAKAVSWAIGHNPGWVTTLTQAGLNPNW